MAVTMRTPGHDYDLAAGFLVSEGVITRGEHFSTARYCAGATDEGQNTYNVLDVTLAPGVVPPDPRLERSFYTTSSCGLCGKASIESLRTRAAPLRPGRARIDAATLTALPARLRGGQEIFAATGGLHAAGLFSLDGTLLTLREDVGRHNAVDKVIGATLRARRFPPDACVLLVSGRASYEIVQKAAVARISVVAAVSAPSSLAVSLAAAMGVTLVGFLRGEGFNVYSHPRRVAGASRAKTRAKTRPKKR